MLEGTRLSVPTSLSAIGESAPLLRVSASCLHFASPTPRSRCDSMEKRAADAPEGGALVETAKKPKTAETTLTTASNGRGAIQVAGPQRTSELLAPIMLLTGHEGPVLSSKFSPDGRHMVSGSHDKLLLLWEVFGECKNTLTFRGHQNAVLELSLIHI